MNPQIGRKGKYLKRPAVRKAGAKTPHACPARRQERLDSPPAPEGRGGRLADGAGGSLPPPPPRFPPPRQRQGRTLLTPPRRGWLPASPETSTTPRRRGVSCARRSAADRRHRAGKARRAAPRSECLAQAGTPRRLGRASAPTRRARLRPRTAVPAKTPPLAP